MIQVKQRVIRNTAPEAQSYDFQEIKSYQYSFCRLKSDHHNVGKISLPDAPIDYLISLNISRLHDIPPDRVCFMPGDTASELIINHPFDLFWFYKRKAQNYKDRLFQPAYGDDDPIALSLLRSVLPVMAQPERASTVFVRHVGDALDAHARNLHTSKAQLRKQNHGHLSMWQMNLAKTTLLASTGRELSISEVADKCGLSASYFSTAFKNSVGKSPLNWLQEQRLEQAKTLLINTSLPLAAIAEHCHFFDQAYFTRLFSRAMGIPPGKWRLLQRFDADGV